MMDLFDELNMGPCMTFTQEGHLSEEIRATRKAQTRNQPQEKSLGLLGPKIPETPVAIGAPGTSPQVIHNAFVHEILSRGISLGHLDSQSIGSEKTIVNKL
jgi:hypothetical protein